MTIPCQYGIILLLVGNGAGHIYLNLAHLILSSHHLRKALIAMAFVSPNLNGMLPTDLNFANLTTTVTGLLGNPLIIAAILVGGALSMAPRIVRFIGGILKGR